MKKLIPAAFLLITFVGALLATPPVPDPDPEVSLVATHVSTPPVPDPDPETSLTVVQLSR